VTSLKLVERISFEKRQEKETSKKRRPKESFSWRRRGAVVIASDKGAEDTGSHPAMV
jgi:hypothetical protein